MYLRRAGLLLPFAISIACRAREAPAGDGATADVAPAASPPNAAHRVGERIRTPHYEIHVSALEDCTEAPRNALADPTRRVGVEVTLVPVGDIRVPANPYYARLVDSAGNVYEATLGGCGAALTPTLPSRAQTARGYVVFDVPRTAQGFTFTYAPELLGAPTEELAIPLGG
jgi:hypothetical protein